MNPIIRKKISETDGMYRMTVYVFGICVYRHTHTFPKENKMRIIGFTQYINDSAGFIPNEEDFEYGETKNKKP